MLDLESGVSLDWTCNYWLLHVSLIVRGWNLKAGLLDQASGVFLLKHQPHPWVVDPGSLDFCLVCGIGAGIFWLMAAVCYCNGLQIFSLRAFTQSTKTVDIDSFLSIHPSRSYAEYQDGSTLLPPALPYNAMSTPRSQPILPQRTLPPRMTEAETLQPKCLNAMPIVIRHVGGATGSTLAFSYLSGRSVLNHRLGFPANGNFRVLEVLDVRNDR
jgi:hypothetical protein